MSDRPAKMARNQKIWIALSASGHIAYHLGCYLTRQELVDSYAARFGVNFYTAGYQPKRVLLVDANDH